MCALTTPWVIDSIIYLGNSPLNKLNKVDIFKLYKLNYGWLHKSALLPACIVSFKSIYLTYNYIKKEKYILPVLYSAGAISLMLILTICSNILYPLISKNSNYSYLVVFWSLILCVGNFIAIAKYQFLDIRLIFSKSLIFLVCWQISFSLVFCLSMQIYLPKFNNTNEIRLTLVLLFFTLIYTISLASFKSLLKNIIGNISNDINVIHTILTKELLNAKTLQHIFITINKFVSFIEGSKWYGQLSNQQQQYISSDPSIPDQTYINHRKAINNTQDPITITTEKNQTILMLNLIENNMSYGWFYIVLPIDKQTWLTQQKKILQTIVTLCVNSIQLMFSYDKINNKIKHLTNANEFISRLSLTSTNTISNIIVTQLKKTFEFDYVILPKHSHYDMDWGASTVDVPKNIRSLVDSLNIPSLFKPPYNPIRYTIDQPQSL